jgi:hypothetical protein
LRIKNRSDHFNPSIKIACHPVGRANVNILIAAVQEIEDTTVLEKPAHNASHGNCLRQAGDAGSYHARTAHDQLNLHARLRGSVKGLNDGQIS